MKRLLLAALLLLVCNMDAARDARACGGPDYGDFGALAPLDSSLSAVLHPDAEWASWGNFDREEFRFLYPFKKERAAQVQGLWAFAHGGTQTLAPPGHAALDAALRSGRSSAIEKQAALVISAWVDLPAAPAAGHAGLLWKAVQAYEEQAFRRTAQPRAASIRLWGAMHALKTQIPNGYSDAIRKKVNAKTFRRIEKHFDDWLALYPKHPLADWVRLFKLRVYFLEGNDAAAWQVLFDMYPRRLPRVLGEMRYLLVQRRQPSSAQVDAVTDPVLIAALANKYTLNQKRFERWRQLSEAAMPRAWAVNLQERLLAWAASKKTLPGRLPRSASLPSPLWGKLRAVALAQTGRYKEAAAQLRGVPVDAEQARLLAAIHFRERQPERAARVVGVSADVREYVVRVELGAASLKQLASLPPADALSRLAGQELSARLAHQGRWSEAARVAVRANPDRKRSWQEAKRLSAQPGGQLRFARFLTSHSGQLFFPERTSFYRGLSAQHERFAPSSKSRRAIAASMVRSSERWLALGLFTAWLEKNPRHPQARRVLREADSQYARLTHWGGGNYFFWGQHAKRSPLVKRLRAVGKLVRAP